MIGWIEMTNERPRKDYVVLLAQLCYFGRDEYNWMYEIGVVKNVEDVEVIPEGETEKLDDYHFWMRITDPFKPNLVTTAYDLSPECISQ